MPPKTKIEMEKIVDEAFSIVREKEFEGLNAIDLAKRLNCSVQPIFHKFKNMDELKSAVMKKILSTYHDYMIKSYRDDYRSYKNMCIRYITFAKEEPKLFKILFMNNIESNIRNFSKEFYKEVEETIKQETGLDTERIKKFHSRIWVFTHGLATLIATNTYIFSDEEINKMLSDIYSGLILNDKNEEGNN